MYQPHPTKQIYSGESENWKVIDYEIITNKEKVRISNTEILKKNHDEYKADYFFLSGHISLKNEPDRDDFIFSNERIADDLPFDEGEELNITRRNTGST